MKLSKLFLEMTEVLQREEVPVGSIGISCETDVNGKREIGRTFRFEYNTKDGAESITGKIEILRPKTRDENYQLDPDDHFDEQYEDELSDAEETVRDNIDKIFKLKDKQHTILKVA